MRPVLAILLLVAPALAGCFASQGDPVLPQPADAAGPAWSLKDTQGVVHARDNASANATILFFMATWCSSCRSKAPLLAEVAAEYAPRGVRTLSVGFDPSESDADLEAWKESYAQPWPHGVDVGQRVARAFGVTSQSSVVVLDAEGVPVQAWGYGRVNGEELRAALERALPA